MSTKAWTAWAVAVLLFASPPTASSAADGTVRATLELRPDSRWLLEYELDSPARWLAFQRAPDTSRIGRWRPLDPAFEIADEAGQERLRRRDGDAFDPVRLELTPTYVPLPADYAPFSPFSDGGMLFHCGRLFACAADCGSAPGRWPIEVRVPPGQLIVRDGRTRRGRDQWVDTDSGRQIYVGTRAPVDTGALLSLVDEALPDRLRTALAVELPRLMEAFAARLGALEHRPVLYASWAAMPDGRHGRQGGVLPDQVFMHWYGAAALEGIDDEEVLAFFAHEIAHLYQGARFPDSEHAWIHEGAADWMSAAVRVAGGTMSAEALERETDRLQAVCARHITEAGGFAAARQREFGLNYACGQVIAARLDAAIRAAGHAGGLFHGWRRFRALSAQGLPLDADGYAAALRALLPPATAERLAAFAGGDDDAAAWRALTAPAPDAPDG